MGDVGLLDVALSLILILVAGTVAWWFRLGVTATLAIATVRAGVQLIAVGFLLAFIVEAAGSMWWAWMWVASMVAITSFVAKRRAPQIPGGALVTLAATAAATGVCLVVIFGLGVLEYTAINVVVIAGITIGNTLPSIVLAGKQLVDALRDGRGRIEALLALGFGVDGITRVAGADIARRALVPQIERTNVVGLIALPGAMTGLLLAGAEPIDAVLVQIIVMYLVLGAVAASTLAAVVLGIRRSFTSDLRVIEIGYDSR